jgi:hypothetical protein
MRTNTTPVVPNDTSQSHSGPPIRLESRTIWRSTCHRPSCRAEWERSGIRTIAGMSDGSVAAYCHRQVYDALGWAAELWSGGEATA